MGIKIESKAIDKKWLDFITPVQVWWIVWIKRNSWASAKADQIIRKSQTKKFDDYAKILLDYWYEWMHPERGGSSLLISLSIILIPQILLSLGFYNYIKLPIFTVHSLKIFRQFSILGQASVDICRQAK